MRRVVMLAVAIVLLAALAVGVGAETCATQVTYQATVSQDQSCSMTVTAAIHLDEPVSELTFPVPVDATNITLNGTRVGSTLTNEARHVDISGIVGNVAGDFTVSLSYYIKDVVEVNDNGFLELQLPLLSGFLYPIQKVGFTLTMPGDLSYKPSFSSGYHQANIEQVLVYSAVNNTVTGTSNQAMKDRETLTMTVLVTEEMFPQAAIQLQDLDPYYIAMAISGVLALVYWLIFLRNPPPRVSSVPTPPEGFSAGQLGSIISLQGTDLTAMIFSWAQLGYLTIQTGRSERVLLHKRMDMGNERSLFEQKNFQRLFGSRSVVDTSGFRYAALYQKLAAGSGNVQSLVHPKSGSKYLFRFLMALVGAFCGVCLGLTVTVEAAVQWFPTVLIALACGGASWLIQQWADSLFSQHNGKLILSLALCVAWIAFSVQAGTYQLDIWIIVLQLLAGLMTTFGGRRTDAGRQLIAEVLGFRLFLQTIPRTQLQQIRRQNPEYFHALAPYALALGCDQIFAKRFGRDKQPPCPYIVGVPQEYMTAEEWNKVLRRTARSMEARMRQMPVEKIAGFFRGLTR